MDGRWEEAGIPGMGNGTYRGAPSVYLPLSPLWVAVGQGFLGKRWVAQETASYFPE